MTPKDSTIAANHEEKKDEEPLVANPDAKQEAEFAEQFFGALLSTQLIQTAYIGHKLGWYTALSKAADLGLTPTELAAQTNSSPRYAKEWLEHQAVAGWIRCVNPSDENRTFVLPKGHASVLADPDSASYSIPMAGLQVGAVGKALDQLVDAYQHNTGVSWDSFGNNARESMAAINRPLFLQMLPNILQDAVLDASTVNKLKLRGGRIVDIGAGYSYSSISAAKTFPAARVDAFDLDAPSVERANALIHDEGLEDRVKAHCMDAAEALNETEFEACDLVMALLCIHDMNDPISVLRTMKKLAAGNDQHAGRTAGTVLVMDEKVSDDFLSSLGNPMDQVAYGFSCTCCLPDGKSYGPNSAETGTVMRPAMLRAFAQQAGFRDIEILAVEHPFFRFYKLIIQ